MKVAIISDTHDNLPNFKKAVEHINKNAVEAIIHCGDVCNPETLKDVLGDFPGKTFVSVGNMDGDRFEDKTIFNDFPRVKIFYEIGEIEFDGKKIAFTHLPETAKKLAVAEKKEPASQSLVSRCGSKYDLVFYGHTHKPWEETLRHGSGQETRMINPGNLSGTFYKATFAIYDTETDKLELKILERLQ